MNVTGSTPKSTRRHFLRGVGTCLALPFMESLLPRSSRAVEKVSREQRMAIISVPFGMVDEKFHPKETGTIHRLPISLRPLANLTSNFTVFSNLDHGVRGGHNACHTFLSGIMGNDRKAHEDGNITIDQRAAELIGNRTRFPSLVFWKEGMSFTRAGVQVPAVRKPSDAFRMMFVDDTTEEKRFQRAAQQSRNSILDAIRQDAKKLRKTLSGEDRDKLDEYFTSIRETEKKLDTPIDWIERPKPKPDDPTMKGVEKGERDERTIGNFTEVWMDLMFLALQTDSTRVVSMAAENGNWALDGVSKGYHQLSHHGQRPDMLGQLEIVETYLMTHVARFITRLKEARQPDGTSLLDSTQVLFGSGLGSGSRHTNDNLPLLLAGGGYRHGRHLDIGRQQPLCNLYLTMLQHMGIELDRFNLSNGTFNGLA